MIDFEKYLFASLFSGIINKNYYADMEPKRVIKPYMIEPVVHHNSDGPNSDGSYFDSSQDEDYLNMDRNWDHELVILFLLFFAFSIE